MLQQERHEAPVEAHVVFDDDHLFIRGFEQPAPQREVARITSEFASAQGAPVGSARRSILIHEFGRQRGMRVEEFIGGSSGRHRCRKFDAALVGIGQTDDPNLRGICHFILR